nr:phosphosulfolactate synthase [Rhodothermus marinus]
MERAFQFLRMNVREPKPRTRGLTEIRGPYYSVMGPNYLRDVLETMGAYIDSLKFAGGSFTLMPRRVLREIIDLCHQYDVLVSTGGFIEYVVTQGPRPCIATSRSAKSWASILSKFPQALSPFRPTTGCV